MAPGEFEQLLAEQVTYYRAIAPEYEEHTLPFEGGDELFAALDAFRPTGSVLELTCGRGLWTEQLLRHATDVTAVDASPEIIDIASTRINSERVRFIEANIFSWEIVDTTSYSSDPGSRTCRSSGSHHSGRWSLTA